MSLVRIDELFDFEKGTLQSSKCTPGRFDFITAASEWKTHNEYSHDAEALVFAAAASGSLGRTHYVNGKFISSDLCFILRAKDTVKYPLDLRFYHIIFNEFKGDIVKNTKAGTSKEAIGLNSFGRYKLPYFPLEVQLATKAKFIKAEETHSKLSTELTHQRSLVKQLRQAFLRDAMQGKLVPQDPNDEPASELLKKIKAEKEQLIKEKKIKKEKELPPIKPEEIPFEIPKSWVWCRLGEIIFDTEGGKSPNCVNESVTGKEWGVIKTTAVQEMTFLENENKILPKGFVVNPRHVVEVGDILITRAGPKNRVGIVCSVDALTKNLILSDKTIRIVYPKELVSSKFIALALNSPLIKPIIEAKMTGMADSQVNISQDNMKGFPIPIPSSSEQFRIVTKLEQLMNYCDELEQSIKQSQTQNEKLLQQVLREALQGKEVVHASV
jgi:type I restriction enzyme, S subunit